MASNPAWNTGRKNMDSIERIAPGDWITIGENRHISGVVCNIRPGRIEAVYLNERNKAMHGEVKWTGKCWDFVHKNDPGKPADKDHRLEPYVKILRSKTTYACPPGVAS